MSAVSAKRRGSGKGRVAGLDPRIPAAFGAVAAAWAGGALLASFGGAEAALAGVPVAAAAAACLAAWRLRPRAGAGEADPIGDLLSAEAVALRFEASGEVADASASARDVLGLAPELLLGNGFFERVHVADRVALLCAAGDLRSGAARRRRVELRLRLPGAGPERFGAFALDLAATDDPDVPLCGSLRDDAAARLLREERDAAVETAQTLKGEQARLLAAVGHELRTPLNAVIGFAEMLNTERFGGFTDPRQKEYAELIRAGGEHLLRTADAMLEAGRLGAGGRTLRHEGFSLGDSLENCRSFLASQAAERGIAIALHVAPGCATVRADRTVVGQVAVNLLSNAVKFSPAGGRVTLEAEPFERGFLLRVGDAGAGMAEAELRRAGTPFERFSTESGAGLGLSLVREMMAAHGGTLTLASRAGRGTVATASFPSYGETLLPAGIAVSTLHQPEGSRHGAIRKTA